jgi:hypothetical protein
MPAQWAHLGADGVLVASSRGAWIQEPGFVGMLGPLGLVGPMPDSLPATEETTRQLLDGAIAAAERAAPHVQEPPITALRWAWNLVSQWHCAHHSVALLPDLIERFEAGERPDLVQFARQKREEERGHDQFAIDDLQALGYDAEALVRHVPPAPTVTAGLNYARRCVHGDQPVEFLGYAYALERRVLNLKGDWLARLDAVLPPGVDAASGVRMHVNELDTEHVDEAIAFFAGLPSADRTAIAVGCYRTTQICCAWSPDQIPSSAELEGRLSRFQLANATSAGPNGREDQGGDREY